jgi:hypothetical protein
VSYSEHEAWAWAPPEQSAWGASVSKTAASPRLPPDGPLILAGIGQATMSSSTVPSPRLPQSSAGLTGGFPSAWSQALLGDDCNSPRIPELNGASHAVPMRAHGCSSPRIVPPLALGPCLPSCSNGTMSPRCGTMSPRCTSRSLGCFSRLPDDGNLDNVERPDGPQQPKGTDEQLKGIACPWINVAVVPQPFHLASDVVDHGPSSCSNPQHEEDPLPTAPLPQWSPRGRMQLKYIHGHTCRRHMPLERELVPSYLLRRYRRPEASIAWL